LSEIELTDEIKGKERMKMVPGMKKDGNLSTAAVTGGGR
jgi:hypothetical protein